MARRLEILDPTTIKDAGTRRLLDPASPARASFEELAENLLALEPDVKSIVVTGPEQQVGCSSVCLGIGAALAGTGRRAAVVDCNLDRPYLHRMLGEPNFVGLTSALESEGSGERHGYDVLPGLLVVPTGPVPSDPWSRLESEEFVTTVRGLEEDRDLVLLDVPIVRQLLGSAALSRRFDGVLLVVHAARTPKNAARAATDDLLDAGVNLLGVVLNGGTW